MNDSEIAELIKSSKKVVGMKQVIKSINHSSIKCVIVADNADDFIKSHIIAKTNEHNIKLICYPSKEKLGKLCDIDVNAAVVGLLKSI